jgi:hypothetical protein
MFRNSHMELNKITLTRWVDQILNNHSQLKTSSLDLRLHLYGLSTPKAMDKTWPLNIYTIININYWGNGNNYTIDEGAYHDQNWGRNMLLHNLYI